MFRNEIKIGMNCALRPRPVDTPAEVQVPAASPRGGSWKIRHLAGDQAGLEEWVPSRMLLCPWSSLPRVLKDEASDRYLADTAQVVDRVTAHAVNLVLVDASGESSEVGILNRPYECILTRAAATVTERANAATDDQVKTGHLRSTVMVMSAGLLGQVLL